MCIKTTPYGASFLWDKNNDYKPVVWLTKDADANALKTGLDFSCNDKTEYRFTFDFVPAFVSWRKFSSENGMIAWWREKIEKGRDYFNWYVHEGPLSIQNAPIHRRVNGEWIEQTKE